MKLRNLMYATMIACAFASCSKDDVVDNGGGNETAGTFLEMHAQKPLSTKADPLNADEIKSLTMVVFGQDGKVEAIESSTEGSTATSRKKAVSAGTKQVMMVANADLSTIQVGAEYSAIAALTNTRAAEVAATGFSMNSKLYTVTVELNKTTFLGYSTFPSGFAANNARLEAADQSGVKLYRNVAKVVLTDVTVTNDKGEFTKYGRPNVEITDVFIMNAKGVTNIVPSTKEEAEKYWASTQNPATTWLAGMAFDASWTNTSNFELGQNAAVSDFLKSTVAGMTLGYYAAENEAALAKTTKAYATVPFYVYENGSTSLSTEAAKTLLVIKANVSYDTKDGRVTVPNRYYSLAIGRTGFVEGFQVTDADGNFPFSSRATIGSGINGATENYAFDVLRNLQYNVALTIKGIGYNEPGGGDPEQYLDVNVQVVPFGAVKQDVEI